MKLLTLLLSLLIANPNALIPKPVEVTPEKGVYTSTSMNPDVKVRRVQQMQHPGEYELKITPKRIVITAADDDGEFYARQTLRQLLMNDRQISCATIKDWPRFQYRAFMLDLGRCYYSVDFIKRQLDAMALMKMNVLHLHLTDNNGWRLQIDKWPLLTEKTAWRLGRDMDEWMKLGCRFVPEGTSGAFGGYYTKEDIREIVRYATERHIDVIPEIDVPSHVFALVSAYPELTCEGYVHPKGDKPVTRKPGQSPAYQADLCIGNPKTYEFIYSVFDEVAELFPSKYFHIGGDEAAKKYWETCPKCKALMEKEGITDMTEFQNLFTIKAVEHLRKLGKTVIAWDEVICDNLPKDVIVMHWRDNTLEAPGHNVIYSHEQFTYLCNNQDYIGKEPKAIKIHTPLNAVYNYEPGKGNVMGVEACLWANRLHDEEISEYQGYPRVAAIAERGWSTKETHDYDDFRERVINMYKIWDKMGIKYFDLRTEMYPFHCVPDGIKVNYYESRSDRGKLPDILTMSDGTKVTPENWQERRAEILDIFQKEMYGSVPATPSAMSYEIIDEGTTLAGFGIRRQIRMWFTADKTGPSADWLVVLPSKAKEKVPAVMLLNYFGNHTILDDPQITLTPNPIGINDLIGGAGVYAGEETRGFFAKSKWRSTYPVDMLLAKGYAFITAAYGDFFPDDPSASDRKHKALATWGWALMRGMDMIETISEIDSKRVVVAGSSRLGKAALIAGAYDERFPVVVLNQTGGGGVPLAKHYYGENIASEMAQFPHWYVKEYGRYTYKEEKLPFDQHMIISCIAPRALLVQGFNDPWFDTKGEFMALSAAQDVWKMLGRGGLGSDKMPEDYDTSAIGDHLGYVRRDLDHGIAIIDWQWLLDFADKQW